ncbi:MAG: hypothetical protein WBO23_17070 [Burkholderiales bacterium]
MWYRLTVGPDCLEAELFFRETAAETREFLVAAESEARRHGCRRVLISVHASRALFKVGEYGLSDYFKELKRVSEYKIALMGDSDELRLSHQYVESLARQHGISVRSFRDRGEALRWFRDLRWSPDRRRRQEPWPGPERRVEQRRRSPEGFLANSSISSADTSD